MPTNGSATTHSCEHARSAAMEADPQLMLVIWPSKISNIFPPTALPRHCIPTLRQPSQIHKPAIFQLNVLNVHQARVKIFCACPRTPTQNLNKTKLNFNVTCACSLFSCWKTVAHTRYRHLKINCAGLPTPTQNLVLMPTNFKPNIHSCTS